MNEPVTPTQETVQESTSTVEPIGTKLEAVSHYDPQSDNLKTLDQMEKEILIRRLEMCDGNRTHTARSLQIGIRTLQRKLKAYGFQNHKVKYGSSARKLSKMELLESAAKYPNFKEWRIAEGSKYQSALKQGLIGYIKDKIWGVTL